MPANHILYDLSSGYPDISLAPRAAFAEITREIIESGNGLQYGGDLKGHTIIREQVAAFLSRSSSPLQATEILVTTGSLQAIECICRTFTEPGDTIAVEAPTFPLALWLFGMNKVKILSLPLEENGLHLALLEDFLRKNPGRLRLLYTIPSYQNPTSICTSLAHRKRLVQLAIQHNFLLLEDTAYHFLNYGSPPPPMLRCLAPLDSHVITVGSFSKLLYPSLRQGWIWARPDQIQQLTRYKTDGSTSMLTSMALATFLEKNVLDSHLDSIRKIYSRKKDFVLSLLKRELTSQASWIAPDGGFYIWLTLAGDITVKALRSLVLTKGVDFLAGQECYTKSTNDSHFRICFTYLQIPQLESAIHILGSCLKEFS